MKIQILVWILFFSLIHSVQVKAEDGYDFAPLNQFDCSIHDLEAVVRKELHAFIETSYYDRTVYFGETKVNPLSLSNKEIESLRFDSLKVFEQYGTGNCVGFSRYFAKRLKTSTGYEFKVISSTVPQYLKQANMPIYPHAALILSCRDGLILVDPSMNIPEPVLVAKEKPAFVDLKYRGIWKFDLNSTEEKILVTADSSRPMSEPWDSKKKLDSEYYYVLKELKNPDEAIVLRHFINDRKVLIYPLTFPHETSYRVVINLIKRQVEFTQTQPDGVVTPLFALTFDEYFEKSKSLEEYFTESVAKKIRIPRETLLRRISNVIDRFESEKK